MKPKSTPFAPAIAVAATFIAVNMAQLTSAATGTWNGAFDGIWDTTPTNWDGLADFTPWDATLGQDNTAIFNTASLAAVVDGPVYTNGITFSTSGALSGSTINLAGTTPTISVATGQTGTISSVVAGLAGLIKSDAGLLTLSNATHTGGTTVSEGRLSLVDTKTGSPNFTTDAELEFNLSTSDQQLIGGTFDGTGTLIKTGASNLILSDWSGNQTIALTGADSVIDVQGGTMSNFFAAGAFGPVVDWSGNEAGLTVASGATFDMINQSVTVDELNGAGTINKDSWDTGVTLTVGVNDGSGTFTGSILNPKNSVTIVKQGTGTQTLSGSGIGYKGGTTVSGGRLVLENTQTGNSSYITNAELEFNLTTGNQQLQSGTFSGTGKLIKTGGNEMILSNWGGAQTVALTGADSVIDVQEGKLSNQYEAAFGAPPTVWTGNKAGLTVASGASFEMNNTSIIVDELNGAGTINKDSWDTALTLTVGVNDGNGTFTGSILNPKNSVALVKQGTGAQRLGGIGSNIAYKGGTTVSVGRLVLENTMTGNWSYTTNAELEFNLTTGDQQINNGTFSGTGKLIKTGTNELTLGNWTGGQTVALTGADSVIDVQAGTLGHFNPSGAFADANNWTGNEAGLTVASGATFQMRNNSVTVDELNGAGTIDKGSFDAVSTLTIGVKDGSGIFSGAITQTGTALSLIKEGSGTQTLSSPCSYTGGTTINGGTLALGASNVLPGILVIGNGTLDAATFTETLGTLDVTAAATIHLGSGATLVFADSNLVEWTGGTLNITGSFVSGASIKFASSAGLDSTQLAAISVNGSGAGTATLDASGYLVMGISDPFTAWSGGAPFDGDDNNDGIENGLAWLLGAADKDVNANGLLPKATQNGGDLKLTFTCLKLASRGTAMLNLQYSKDLGITDLWSTHEVAVPDAVGTVGSVTFTVPSVNPDPDLINLEATIPASAAAPGTKLFARLNGKN